MKIAVSATTPDVEAQLDPRLGRAANFVLVDSETGEWEAYPNAAVGASGGAGVQAAQFVVDHGAQVIVSGDFGPHAFTALSAAGIKMFVARAGTVRELVNRFKSGELREVTAAARRSGYGLGRGGAR